MLFGLLFLFKATVSVRSAGVTPGALDSLSIRGGVATIAPGGSSDSIMELGNEGNQIASTGTIYFRPNSSASGSRLTGMGVAHDLTMTGSVTVNGAISLNGIAYEGWPDSDGWVTKNYSTGDYLIPIRSTMVVDTGLVVTVPGLSVYENSPSDVGLRVSNSLLEGTTETRTAATFSNTDLTLSDTLRIRSTDTVNPLLTVGGQQVWYSRNDGFGSGLDADLLDGNDTYFAPNCGQAADAFCLCVTTNGQNHCAMTKVKSYDLP